MVIRIATTPNCRRLLISSLPMLQTPGIYSFDFITVPYIEKFIVYEYRQLFCTFHVVKKGPKEIVTDYC